MREKVLLHICCGICAPYPIEYLKEKGFSVCGFFFNPNIYPQEEYKRRREVVDKISILNNIKVIEGNYSHKSWKDLCDIYKDEQEGGKRCSLCYRIRLEETKKVASDLNFDYFTTTLTISPHKDTKIIFEVANSIDNKKFIFIDFKKNDGFKKTIESAKKYNLYRQNYCGCEYSLR